MTTNDAKVHQTNQNTIQHPDRLQALDGLKGGLMLTILMYYFYQYLAPGGYAAVNGFLFVAGFLNFRHFYKADATGLAVNWAPYYKKRFERLFFPMLAVILATAAYILVFDRSFLYNLRNMGLSALVFVNNLYQLIHNQSYFVQAVNPSPFGHLWYISILGHFIILTPVMVTAFYQWHRRPSLAINFLLAISLISAFAMVYFYYRLDDPSSIYFNPITRLSAYTLGGAVGYLYPVKLSPRTLNRQTKLAFNIIGLVAFTTLMVLTLFMYGTSPFSYKFGLNLYTVIFMVLFVVVMHPETLWHKVCLFRPLAFIGRRSLSIYLWFYPIHLMMPQLLGSWVSNLDVSNLIQFLIILVLSEVNYRLFEQKSLYLPIGQSFNLSQLKDRLAILSKSGKGLAKEKTTTITYLIIATFGVVGLFSAPETRGQATAQLEQQINQGANQEQDTQSQSIKSDVTSISIEENQSQEEQFEAEESEINQSETDEGTDQPEITQTDPSRVINHIEGLDQPVMLFANGLDATFYGDSTLLAAAESIQEVFPNAKINGEVGRQLYRSATDIKWLDSEGLISPTVVLMLGANGTFTSNQLDDVIAAFGDRPIYLVTSNAQRSWVPNANQQLIEGANRHSNVLLIDWASYAADHPDWLMEEDKAHPTVEGAEEMARFIANEIYRLR